MEQGRGLVKICGVEFGLAKGCKRSSYSRVQQGGISYAFQPAASSGNDPFMDLIDANEQTTDDLSRVSHGLEAGQFFEQRFVLVDQLIHKLFCTVLKRFGPRVLAVCESGGKPLM
jgi:hypothetical protein